MDFKYFYQFFTVFLKFFKKNICRTTAILHQSKNFIIVSKAYDLKINSNKYTEATVQTFLKQKHPTLASNRLYHEFYFVHRLDYSTSGLMCIPVHKKACQVVAKAIEMRHCKKYYVALVRGYLSRRLLNLNFALGRDPRVREIEKMCVPFSENKFDKNAQTLIIILERGIYDNYPSSKVLIKPITGRRHQIRVHCSHIGHTIIGDYTYSNKKDIKPERMFLHSIRLVIPNEIENLDIQTEDPFTEKHITEWQCLYKFYTLDEAFEALDKFEEKNKF